MQTSERFRFDRVRLFEQPARRHTRAFASGQQFLPPAGDGRNNHYAGESDKSSDVAGTMDSAVQPLAHKCEEHAAEESAKESNSQVQQTARTRRTVEDAGAVHDANVAGLGGGSDAGFLHLAVKRVVEIRIGLGFLLELVVLRNLVELLGSGLDLIAHHVLAGLGRGVSG